MTLLREKSYFFKFTTNLINYIYDDCKKNISKIITPVIKDYDTLIADKMISFSTQVVKNDVLEYYSHRYASRYIEVIT